MVPSALAILVRRNQVGELLSWILSLNVYAIFDGADYNDFAGFIGGASGIFGQSNIGLPYV